MLIDDGEAVLASTLDRPKKEWQIQAFASGIWLPELKKSSKSWSLSERIFRKYISPYLGWRKFSDLDTKAILAWIARIDELDVVPSTRNRIFFVLKNLLKMAFEQGLLASENLDEFLRKNLVPQQRQNKALIESDKIRQLWRSLRQNSSLQARVVELLLLTGASKSEILSARWEDLDLEHNQLEVDGHNGKKRKIWLGPRTREILAAIDRKPESPWIFPGKKAQKHISDIFQFWNNLRAACGLENLRIQDLRHNYVNWQNLREGYSPAIESEIDNVPAKKPRQNQGESAVSQKVAIEAVYTHASDSGGAAAESVRNFMRELAQKFLSDPAFAKSGLKKRRCGFFWGFDPDIQRDFNMEICMEKLAAAGQSNLPGSPAGFLKSLCRIHGPAIAVESERYPVLEALRLARASIVSGTVDMALVGGMAGISGANRDNRYAGVAILLKPETGKHGKTDDQIRSDEFLDEFLADAESNNLLEIFGLTGAENRILAE